MPLPAERQCWEIFGESLIVSTRQFTRKVPQHITALLDITLFSDKQQENGHCQYIFTLFWVNLIDALPKTTYYDLKNEGN